MRDTKTKIIEQSLRLFNERGFENVTVRDIAKEIGISHGNLCYHYPSTNDIAFELYQNLVFALDQRITKELDENSIIEELVTSSQYAIEKFYEYKFIMLDFVSVMRKNDKIRTHYIELEKYRNIQFKTVFHKLREFGIMRDEIYPKEYDNLISAWFILGDFWMAHAEINFTGNEKEKIEHYSNLIFSLFVPFLTNKGLQLLNEFRIKQNIE